MKETIKPLFPILLSSLCALFALLLFSSVKKLPYELFLETSPVVTTLSFEDFSLKDDTSPSLKYMGNTLTIGEQVYFPSLFQLIDETGTISTITPESNIQIYLLDVTNSSNNSQLTILSSADMESLEEIPSAAIYDKSHSLLTFYQSGIYTIHLRMHYKNQPGILYTFSLPVETR